jgi:GYF domain 2
METTYTILGADGLQYGPINLDHLKIWIREGRITAETKVLRSDTNAWLPAAQYAELQLAATPPVMAAPSVPTVVPTNNPALEKQIKSGADWFFWIAGLSLINTFIGMGGGGVRFAIGLGITQVIDGMLGGQSGGVGSIIGMALSVLIAGMFILFGVFARKRQNWSFIVGMVLYALDGLLLVLLGGGILSIGFHGFALFCIFVGLRANSQLQALEKGLVPVTK